MSPKASLAASLVLLSVVLNSYGESSAVPRASFGEACGSNGTRCDSRSFLTCIENKCECIKPKEMTFDKSHGKCLVLSGERCSYTAIENSQEKKWTENLDCVENAICSNEGFCSCSPNYFEDTQGFCVPKRMYGQSCSEIQKCREDKYLMCDGGICTCNSTDTIFDSEKNQCVVKAGKSCLNGKPCVKNAYCPDSWYNNPRNCTCRDNYKTSKNGLCLSQYNAQCNSQTEPCLEDLACINQLCSCPYPEHQTYNYGSNKCVSFVRGPCRENVTENILEFPCVSGAECQSDDGTANIFECRCSTGFIESDKRTCAIEYGQSCEINKGKNICDGVAKLICKNGKCACPGFQVYNNVTNSCEGLVGAKCNLGDNFCVEGAYCEGFRDSKLGEGVCKCGVSFVVDSNRKCVKRDIVS